MILLYNIDKIEDLMEKLTINSFETILASANPEKYQQDPDYVDLWEEDLRQALENPEVDFFERRPLVDPKKEIGLYVDSCGFLVPIIKSFAEWQKVIDSDRAMIRSESPQDYSGFNGVSDSLVLNFREHYLETLHYLQPIENKSFAQPEFELEDFLRSGCQSPLDYSINEAIKSNPLAQRDFRSLNLLRNGCLSTQDYLINECRKRFNFLNRHTIEHQAKKFGFNLDQSVSTIPHGASEWTYIDGDNWKIFGDPNIEGRFYLACKSKWDPPDGFLIDSDEHQKPMKLDNRPNIFIAKPFIDYYNKIRNLPMFDTTQMPVLEIQVDRLGNIYFLQYYKTGRKIDYAAPKKIILPKNSNAFITNNVRGVAEGEEYKLFLNQNIIDDSMKNQAIFFGGETDYRHEYALQFFCKTVDFVFHKECLTLNDNHYSDAAVFQLKLAAGLEGNYLTKDRQSLANQGIIKRIKSLMAEYKSLSPRNSPGEKLSYIDIKVTANGRQLVMESDWEVKTY